MMSGGVLVLNRSYQPVHVTSVRRAFTLLYLGIARALDQRHEAFDFESWAALSAELGDDVIHTTRRVIKVPRVIILQVYDRLPQAKVRLSRLNIYARDHNTCQYCGRALPRVELNLDHVVPRAQGGRTTWENVVCCCVPCNLRKGARTPAEAGMRLLHQPRRPPFSPVFRAPGNALGNGGRMHREWIPFLGLADASYWNAELEEE